MFLYTHLHVIDVVISYTQSAPHSAWEHFVRSEGISQALKILSPQNFSALGLTALIATRLLDATHAAAWIPRASLRFLLGAENLRTKRYTFSSRFLVLRRIGQEHFLRRHLENFSTLTFRPLLLKWCPKSLSLPTRRVPRTLLGSTSFAPLTLCSQ